MKNGWRTVVVFVRLYGMRLLRSLAVARNDDSWSHCEKQSDETISSVNTQHQNTPCSSIPGVCWRRGQSHRQSAVAFLFFAYLWAIGGCTLHAIPPANNLANGQFYSPEKQNPGERVHVYRETLGPDPQYYDESHPYQRYAGSSRIAFTDSATDKMFMSEAQEGLTDDLPLSPGDRVRIRVVDGELLNGDYEVNLDGTLQLPYLKPHKMSGRTIQDVEQILTHALVDEGLFKKHFVKVSVRQLSWGPIQAYVAGAVFEPGQVLLNNREAEERAQQVTQAGGDYAPRRTLTVALQAAGGVRPDADLRRIVIVRSARYQIVDLSGIIHGIKVTDPPLAAGDQVIVGSTGEFQHSLVRPSQITPPGIAIYMSNLSVPATGNSVSAINRDTTHMPYGLRLLQGAVAANCVGGTPATNGSRYVVLASRNPLTGKTEVIERSVEQLIRDAHRDEFNPYLLSGDAIACYDSTMTSVRDVARTVADVLFPLTMRSVLP